MIHPGGYKVAASCRQWRCLLVCSSRKIMAKKPFQTQLHYLTLILSFLPHIPKNPPTPAGDSTPAMKLHLLFQEQHHWIHDVTWWLSFFYGRILNKIIQVLLLKILPMSFLETSSPTIWVHKLSWLIILHWCLTSQRQSNWSSKEGIEHCLPLPEVV